MSRLSARLASLEKRHAQAKSSEDLKADILKYVTEEDHVSFAGLCNRLGSYALRGNITLFAPGSDSIVVWAGMSEVFAGAIADLVQGPTGPLVMIPCSPMVYFFDGASLDMPIAKRASEYKTPHWVPVVLRPRARCTEMIARAQKSGKKRRTA